MNSFEKQPNANDKAAFDEALAKLRSHPKVIEGFKKREEEMARYGVQPKPKIMRPPTPKSPPQKHFSEVEQPELIHINGEWVRKEE